MYFKITLATQNFTVRNHQDLDRRVKSIMKKSHNLLPKKREHLFAKSVEKKVTTVRLWNTSRQITWKAWLSIATTVERLSGQKMLAINTSYSITHINESDTQNIFLSRTRDLLRRYKASCVKDFEWLKLLQVSYSAYSLEMSRFWISLGATLICRQFLDCYA